MPEDMPCSFLVSRSSGTSKAADPYPSSATGTSVAADPSAADRSIAATAAVGSAHFAIAV